MRRLSAKASPPGLYGAYEQKPPHSRGAWALDTMLINLPPQCESIGRGNGTKVKGN